MGDVIELIADRLVEGGVAVAVDVAPQRRDAVDVAPAIRVDQVGALAGVDRQRLGLDPSALLGEGVPDVPVIERSHGSGIRHPLRTLGLDAAGKAALGV